MDKLKSIFSSSSKDDKTDIDDPSGTTHTSNAPADLTSTSRTHDGIGGGVVDDTGSYGATPGKGLTSYIPDSSTGTSTSATDPASTNLPTSSTTGTTTTTTTAATSDPITTNAPQIGGTNAPQVGQPDLGERFDATAESSAFTGTGGTTTYGQSALTGSALPDRSVAAQSTGEYTSTPLASVQPTFTERKYELGGSHPTFTGNRLDPNFKESTPTFHEEQLDDKTHHGGGWVAGASESGGDVGTTGATGASRSGATAAAVGTAAVAGGAAYEASSAQTGNTAVTDSGPASKTVGPHDSNLANIVDPRVQPDLSKTSKTTETPVATKPTSATQTSTTHAERDAGLAAGAGAGAATAGVAGVVAHEHHDQSTTATGTTTGDKEWSHDDPTGPSTVHGTDQHLIDTDYLNKTTAPPSGAAAFRDDPISPETTLAGGPGPDPSDVVGAHPGTEKQHHGLLDKLLHRDNPNKLHKDRPTE